MSYTSLRRPRKGAEGLQGRVLLPTPLQSLFLFLAFVTPLECGRFDARSADKQEIDPLTVAGAIAAAGSVFSAYKLYLQRVEAEHEREEAQAFMHDLDVTLKAECLVLARIDCSLMEQREKLAQLREADPDNAKLNAFCTGSPKRRQRLEAFLEQEMLKNCDLLGSNSFCHKTTRSGLVQRLCEEASTRDPAARARLTWQADVQRLRLDTILKSQCDVLQHDFERACPGVDVEGMMPSSPTRASALSEISEASVLQVPGLDVILGIAFTALSYSSTSYDVYDSFVKQGSAYSILNDMVQKQLESRCKSMRTKLEDLYMKKALDSAWTAAVLRHGMGQSEDEDGGFGSISEWTLEEGSRWFCNDDVGCLQQEPTKTKWHPGVACIGKDSLHGEDMVRVCGVGENGNSMGPPANTAYIPQECFEISFTSQPGPSPTWVLTYKPKTKNRLASKQYNEEACDKPIKDYKRSSGQLWLASAEIRKLSCSL